MDIKERMRRLNLNSHYGLYPRRNSMTDNDFLHTCAELQYAYASDKISIYEIRIDVTNQNLIYVTAISDNSEIIVTLSRFIDSVADISVDSFKETIDSMLSLVGIYKKGGKHD